MSTARTEGEPLKVNKSRRNKRLFSDCHERLAASLGKQPTNGGSVSYQGGELLPPVSPRVTVEMMGRFTLNGMNSCQGGALGGKHLDEEWESVLSRIDWSHKSSEWASNMGESNPTVGTAGNCEGRRNNGEGGSKGFVPSRPEGACDDHLARGWALFRAICSPGQTLPDSELAGG